MSTIGLALLLGLGSMVIVFVSGIVSDVVRITTLLGRCALAFCMTSAASYFCIMLFDLIDEKFFKPAETDTDTAAELSEDQSAVEGFQPMDVSKLPNAEK